MSARWGLLGSRVDIVERTVDAFRVTDDSGLLSAIPVVLSCALFDVVLKL